MKYVAQLIFQLIDIWKLDKFFQSLNEERYRKTEADFVMLSSRI